MPSPATRLLAAGRSGPTVAPPLQRASTFLFDTVEELERAKADRFEHGTVFYGRFGTPDTFAFEDAISTLEGACGTLALPSGLAACVLAPMAMLKAGDHLLVTDSAYDPARNSLRCLLARNGVEVEFHDPRIGAGIADLLRPNTRMIYLESPGSLTFEVQDVPAIAAVARDRGILTVCDNTWATGLLHRPLELGCDISVQAATKYVIGHSDAMLGTLSFADPALRRPLREMAGALGYRVSPDDVYLAQRGLRTLDVRLARHGSNAIALSQWLETQPGIRRVIQPALPSHPDHAIWARDFRGTSGLFAIILDTEERQRAVRFVEALRHFGLGFSWGGFESLALLANPAASRDATRWTETGQLCRLHVGLDCVDDLRRDITQALGAAGLN